MNVPEPRTANPPPDLRARILGRASAARQEPVGRLFSPPAALAAVLLFGAGLAVFLLPVGSRESERAEDFVRETKSQAERVIAWLSQSGGRRGS